MTAGTARTRPSTVTAVRAAGKKSSQFQPGCLTASVKSSAYGLRARFGTFGPKM